MHLIVGLGNPGTSYENTRHNLGAAVVELIAVQNRVKFTEDKKAQALVARFSAGAEPVILIKPQTYMNESGRAVKEIMKYQPMGPEGIIVIYDDVDLELGEIRVRGKGSSGGHKGVESVTQSLGTPAFPRVRIGIGKNYARGTADEYVLKKIPPSEKEPLEFAVALAADAALAIVTDGLEAAMNRFNAPHISI